MGFELASGILGRALSLALDIALFNAPDAEVPDWLVERSRERWFQATVWFLVVLALALLLLVFVILPVWCIWTVAITLGPAGTDPSLVLALPAALGLAAASMLFWLWRGSRARRRGSSVERLMTRAEGGDATSAYELAQAYRRGARGLALDGLAARVWLARAAASGHPPAMLLLAEMLRTGEGGVRDEAAAREWLRRAAEGGGPEAARRLAPPAREGP
jgi:TPR repeat protein